MDELVIRPMRTTDIEAAEQLTAESYLRVDEATARSTGPAPTRRSPARAQNWHRKTRHFLTTDPGGCWIAERAGELIGVATSLRRESMWILASFAVRPDRQGEGIGRQLLEAAGQHSRGALRAMLNASPDAGALRRYHSAGFTLLPHLRCRGTVAREVLPVVRHVRPGDESDFDLLDSIDRRVRGAAHGADHHHLATEGRLIVTDRPAGSGYAWVAPDGEPILLAATNRAAARSVLWEALAGSDPESPVSVGHVSGANQWVLDVAMAARMEVSTPGFLALRGMTEPHPYLPHGTVL